MFTDKVSDILQRILKQMAEFHDHINTKKIRGEKKVQEDSYAKRTGRQCRIIPPPKRTSGDG